MSGVATAVVASAVIGSQASKSAAKTQAGASQAATDAQLEMFERQIELQKPYREAGEEALNRLRAGTKVGGEFDKAFSETQFTADPGYAFRMSEGMKALDRSAAARGGLLSGSTLKGAQRYGQDLASQEYQNAFNRYYAERTNKLQPLQSLAGVGQTSANTLSNAAGQFGSQIGSNIIGAGNAMAAGQIGQANAISQGVGQGINFYQNQQMMNKLFPTASPNSPASGWQQSSTGLYTID
jgi:hypothetical protein